MSDVLALAGVSVVRGDTVILDDVSWEVEEGQRWVVLGPNGAGKTTLLQVAAARIHPTTGVTGILGEVLGTVDVFELRPRIGLASAALAERMERLHAFIPYQRNDLLALWRQRGVIDEERFDASGTYVSGRLPPAISAQLARFRVNGDARREARRARG